MKGQRELLEQLNDVVGSSTVRGDLPSCKIWSSYSNVAEDLNLQSCSSVIWHYIICYMTLNNLHPEAATPHVLAINWIWSGSVMQQNSGLFFGLFTGWNVCVEGCAVGCVLGEMCVSKGVLWAVYWGKCVCWSLKFMLISLFPLNMCRWVPGLFPGTYAAVAWYWTATSSCAEVKETV